jgi:integrase
MPDFRIGYSLREAVAGLSLVYADFTVSGVRSSRVSTGVKVQTSAWDVGTRRSRSDTAANKQLTAFEAGVQRTAGKLPKGYTADMLKRAVAAGEGEPLPERTIDYETLFEQMMSRGKRRESSVKQFRYDFAKAKQFLPPAEPNKQWARKTPDLIAEGVSVHTANSRIMLLNMLLRFAHEEDVIDRLVLLKRFPAPEGSIAPFQDKEALRQFAEALRQKYYGSYLLFSVQLITGLSYSDTVRLAPEHLKELHGQTLVLIARQKTGGLSPVPIHTEDLPLLREWLAVPLKSRPNYHTHGKRCDSVAKSLGMEAEDFQRTHKARKTAANRWLNEEGRPIEAVSKMLGHKSITTTQKYYADTNTDFVLKAARKAWKEKGK